MKRLPSNERGFTHYLLLFVMILLIAGFAYIGAKRIISSQADTLGDFTYQATHPQAQNQATTTGKALITLKPYNGKIYAGYGDYGNNTGPIDVTPFDPPTNTFSPSTALVDGTEQIALYRIINSKLYAVSIDPSGLSLSSYYAAGDSGSNWTQRLVNTSGAPLMEHVFDIATLNGTDLWLAGSYLNDAVVYHSTDGGATWTKSYDLAVAGRVERFYAIGSFNGKLYVQASAFDTAQTTSYPLEATSQVFNGTSWSNGVSLGSGYYFWHPEVFAGKMVYINNCPCNGAAGTALYSLNSSNVVQVVAAPVAFYEYTIDGTTLYALGTDGKVYSTTDLVHWYIQASGITTGRSVAVLNGQIYVGTTDSKIYKAPVNANPPLAGSTSTTTVTPTPKPHGGGSGGGGGGHKK